MPEIKFLPQGKGIYTEEQKLKFLKFEAANVRLHDLYLKVEMVLLCLVKELHNERDVLVKTIIMYEEYCFGENSDQYDQETYLEALNRYKNESRELDITQGEINKIILNLKPIDTEFEKVIKNLSQDDRFKMFELSSKLGTLYITQFDKIINTLNTIFTHYNPDPAQKVVYDVNLPSIINEFEFSTKMYDLRQSLLQLSIYHDDLRPNISDLIDFYDQMAIDAKNRLFENYPSDLSQNDRNIQTRVYLELKKESKAKAEIFLKNLLTPENNNLSLNELVMFFMYRNYIRYKKTNF